MRKLLTFLVAPVALAAVAAATLPAAAQAPGHGCVANCYLDSNFDAGTGASPSTFWRGDGKWFPPQTPSLYVTGGTNWYLPNTNMGAFAGAALSANTMYCAFGGVSQSVTIKALAVRVTIAQTSAHAQMAIYSFGSTPGNTGTLVDSIASVSAATSSVNVSASAANGTDTLSQGTLYAFCTNTDTAGVGMSSYGIVTTGAALLIGTTTANLTNVLAAGAQINGKSIAQTFGTWPGTITSSSMTDVIAATMPMVALEVN